MTISERHKRTERWIATVYPGRTWLSSFRAHSHQAARGVPAVRMRNPEPEGEAGVARTESSPEEGTQLPRWPALSPGCCRGRKVTGRRDFCRARTPEASAARCDNRPLSRGCAAICALPPQSARPAWRLPGSPLCVFLSSASAHHTCRFVRRIPRLGWRLS